MCKAPDLAPVLQNGGFVLHYYVGRLFKVGFIGQCFLVTAAFAAALVVGSVFDRSLVLEGRNLGLLEHPTIWAFFVLQIALPITIRQSLLKVRAADVKNREIARAKDSPKLDLAPIVRFLHFESKTSKLVGTLIFCVGLMAFAWNTYQNQLPGVVVPYDFWDSKNYFWGFWLTRIYKVYLFGLLLPYIAMIHIAILTVILRLVRAERLAGKIELLPFHPDGVGGLGFIAGLVSTPVIVTLLVGSLPTAAAFVVHKSLDITPLIGLITLVGWALIGYLVPILFLKSDIVGMRNHTIKRLRCLQQDYYCEIVEGRTLDFDKLRKGNEALDYFDKVCTRLQSISNYPHLRRLIRYVGLASTPTILSLGIKVYQSAGPILTPFLKRL